ncbi:RNB domain-containing ribonuclease [bacterium]|nr:RNB domain-containing ribonuclease [candidate division CSSED10-310 bacterium]
MNERTSINPGDAVEIFEQKRLMTALCLGYKKNRLSLITETSKVLNLSPSRVVHLSRNRIEPGTSRKIIIDFLRQLSENRARIAGSILLEKLWQATPCKGKWFDLTDMECPAGFIDSSISRDDCLAGIVRAIYQDRCYFRHSENRVYVSTPEEVQETLKHIEEQAKENILITRLSEWLNAKLHSQSCSDPEPDVYHRFIDALKADAAQIADQPDRNFVTAVLKNIRKYPGLTAFDILVYLGEFEPDENLDILRLRYPVVFSIQALAELEQMQKVVLPVSSSRRDYTDLSCFTIDGPQTLDFDDAVSCIKLPDNRLQIGIHITDVAYWVSPGSFLDEEARERGQTLYLPRKTWHMFPTAFAESVASLHTGATKPALSILIHFKTSINGNPGASSDSGVTNDFLPSIESITIEPSLINVRHRLTYDDVDARIAEEPFSMLLKLAVALRHNRLQNGAIIIPRPELTIDARNPARIVIQKRNRQSNAQLIVSELMILANQKIAEKAAESGIAFPFRCQQAPEEPVPRSDEIFNPYISYCQRRVMPRADQSLVSRKHFTLGLSSYTNITSPMRRYFDVIAQRQFRAILGHDEPYSRQELDSILKDLEQSVARAATIAYRQNRYWLLKYLSGFEGQTITAMILDRYANGYQIWLEDLCIDADLPLSFSKKLYPEQVISVMIERVSPRDDVLKLRLAE